jgi:hypothetical protein
MCGMPLAKQLSLNRPLFHKAGTSTSVHYLMPYEEDCCKLTSGLQRDFGLQVAHK